MPSGKITKVAAREKDGRLQFVLFNQPESGAFTTVAWLSDTPIGNALPLKERSAKDLPADLSELVRRGIRRIGTTPNCLEMTDHAVALALGEMGAVQIALTVSGNPMVFSLNENIAIAEETQPRNSDLQKNWGAVFLPQSDASDILQVHWMFLKDALATVKDAPLTLLTQPNRLAKAPPWAAQLAEVLTTRSADKLRKLASQAGWLVQFPFEKSPYATKIDNRVQ